MIRRFLCWIGRSRFNIWNKYSVDGKFGIWGEYFPNEYLKIRICFYWFGLAFIYFCGKVKR